MSARKSIKSTSDSPTPEVPAVVEEKIQQQQQQQQQQEQESLVEVKSESTNAENQELEEKDITKEEQDLEDIVEDTVVKEEEQIQTTNCSTTTTVVEEGIKEEAAIVSETLSAETEVTDNAIQIVPTVKVEKEEDCLVNNVGDGGGVPATSSPQLSPVDFPSTPSASASLAKDHKRRPTTTSTPSSGTKKDRAEDEGETDVEDDKSIISTTSSTTLNSDICRDKETPTPTPTQTQTISGELGNDIAMESPTKSKKRRITYDKSAIVTRKTKQDLITAAAAAAQPVRSLRAGRRRNTSESETTPSAVYITKRKYVRRATVAATSTSTSTPTKRKRSDSTSSKTQDDKEDPDDSKKIAKMEKEIQEQDVVKSQPSVEHTDEISEKDTAATPIDESLLNDDQSDGDGGESAMDESFDSTFMAEDNDNAEALVEKRRASTTKKCTKLKETSKSKTGGGTPRAEKRTGTRRKSMIGDDSMNVENGKDSPDNLAYVKPKRGRPKKTEMLSTTPKRRRAIKKNQKVLSQSSEDLTNATVAALPTASVTPSQSQEYSPVLPESAADATAQCPSPSTILIIATAPNPADTVVTRFDNFQKSPDDDGESKTGAVAPITTHIVSQCDTDTALPPSIAAVTPTVNGVSEDSLTIMTVLPKNIPTDQNVKTGDSVSMISVSQFYKKPEFIENSFGKVEDEKDIVNTNPDIRTYTTASPTNQRSVPIRTSARRRSMEQNKQTVPVKTYRTYRKAPRAEAKKVEPQVKNDHDHDNDNDIDIDIDEDKDKDINKHVSDSETTDQSKADTTLDETKILSDSLSQVEIDGLIDGSDTKVHDEDANVGDNGNKVDNVVVGDGDDNGDKGIMMSNADDDNSFSNKCDNEILAVVPDPESKDHQEIDEMNVKDTENQNDNDNDNDNEKSDSQPTNTQLNRRSSSLSSKPSTSNYPKRSYPAYTRNSTSTLTPDRTNKSKWMEEDNEDAVPLTNTLSPSSPSVREKTHIIVKRDYLSDIKNKEKQINKQQDIEVNNENVIENSTGSSSNSKNIITSSIRTRRSTQTESSCTNNNMRKTDEINIDRNYCTDIKADKDNDCDDIVKRQITHDNDHIIDVEIKDTSKSDQCNDQLKENKENIKDHLDTIKNDHDNNHQDDNDETNIIFNIDSVQIKMDDVSSSIKKHQETPETLKQKENHLKSLGLLTHKAAVQAQIEKQRRREMLKSTAGLEGNEQDQNDSSDNHILKNTNDNNSSKDIGNNTITTSSCSNGDGNSPTNGGQGNSNNKTSQEYTGTLKTVIKLNRQASNNQSNEKRNKTTVAVVGGVGGGNRLPLKMTFQKGRGRGGAHLDKDNSNTTTTTGEESYYTIQNEAENTHQEAVTHGRKSHNRSHTTESTTQGGDANTSTQPAATGGGGDKKDGPKDHILIPEKASSFSIHPDRLCQDQCFYCGGKFGLYDTPCHVAQIKSLERQQKILENEEKLTVDYCLCDACFRHVTRRANCPAYKKRVSGPSHLEPNSGSNDATETTNQIDNNGDTDKPISNTTTTNQNQQTINRSVCFVYDCNERATHSLRRKRLRKTIRKLLPNEYNMFNGLIPICDKHYEVIYHFMECALCKRRLIRNHVFHITHDVLPKLEKLLIAQGFPVHFRDNTVVCKLCKYFTKLLLKPPEGKSQKALFVKNYRRRLLNLYNIQTEDKDDDDDEGENSEIEEEKPIEATSSTKSSTNKDNNKDDSIAISVQKRRRKQKLSTSPIVPTTNETSNNNRDDTQSSDDCNIQQQQQQQHQQQQTSIIAGSGQIALDNDVMVDYDVPILDDEVASSSSSPPPQPPTPSSSSSSSLMRNMSLPSSTVVTSKLQSILQGGGGGGGSSGSSGCSSVKDDISIALRSNPNISMRELFPGEEEMGLQVGLPFGGSTSHKTPEGWTRVQTFLQYDEPTRRLWEDLQKPYGNQSSFLRHLILLEKYFRNGDLILSQNASSNAVVYSESVQSRLRSFDNINERNRRKSNNSENNRSKQINENTSITITARPKSSSSSTNATSPSSSSTLSYNNNNNQTLDSILKTNLLGNKNSSIEILPINSNDSSNDSSTNSNNCGGNSLTKQQKLLAAASRLIHNDDTNGRHSNSSTISGSKKNGYNPINNNCNNGSNISSSTSSYPPELISINQGSNSLLLANNKNQQHNYQSYSSQNSYSSLSPMSNVSGGGGGGGSGVGHHHSSNHVPSKLTKLRDTLTSAEIAQGKSWRPTLMPIKSVPAHLIRKDELYETVDGRRLPAFVQVQSGHRPYLISIYDYNRMCMLRRDKIEQALKVTNSNSCSSTTATTSSTTTNNNYNNNNCNNSHNITATIDLETEFNTKSMSQHYHHQQQQQQHHQHQQHRMHQQQIQNKLQIPNKILEQNSLLPISMTNRHQRSYSGEQKPIKRILPKPSSLLLVPLTVPPKHSNQTQHQQQQQQQQMQQHPSQPSVAPAQTEITATTASSNMVSLIPNISAVFLGSQQQQQQQQQNQFMQQGPKASTSWLWSSNTEDNNVNTNGMVIPSSNNRTPGVTPATAAATAAAAVATASSSNSSSPLGGIVKQQQNSNFNNNSSPLILDDSLFLKIPKSLTVIPQQKGHGRLNSRMNSMEDANSA